MTNICWKGIKKAKFLLFSITPTVLCLHKKARPFHKILQYILLDKHISNTGIFYAFIEILSTPFFSQPRTYIYPFPFNLKRKMRIWENAIINHFIVIHQRLDRFPSVGNCDQISSISKESRTSN